MRMNRRGIEIGMGLAVLITAILFVFTSYAFRDIDTDPGYSVFARFNRVDGLGIGAPVKMGGFQIGTVVDQKIDPRDFSAMVELNVASSYRVPADSTATINGDGLIGGKYIKIEPGDAPTSIEPDAFFTETKDVIDIEGLVRDILNLAITGCSCAEEGEGSGGGFGSSN